MLTKQQLVDKLTKLVVDDADVQAYVREQMLTQFKFDAKIDTGEDTVDAYRYCAIETHVISHLLNETITNLDHSFK